MALIYIIMIRNVRLLSLFSLLFFFSTTVTQAAWWNPFEWFDEEEELLNLRPATLLEEAESKNLYDEAIAAFDAGRYRKANSLFNKIVKDFS